MPLVKTLKIICTTVALVITMALACSACLEGQLRSEGSSCQIDKDCGPGLFCDQSAGRCAPPPSADASSDSDAETKPIWIVSPANGSFVGNRIDVRVEVASPSMVERIEIWLDGQLIATYSKGPVSFERQLDSVDAGLHVLSATLRDRAGRLFAAQAAFELDTAPPEVELFSASAVVAKDPLAVTVAATDRSGLVSIVAWIEGAEKTIPASEKVLGSGIRVFEFGTNGLSLGEHTVLVVATDRAGLSTTKAKAFLVQNVPSSACANDLQCTTGFCSQGVCCESRCNGDCESCNTSGKEGKCEHLSIAVGNKTCKANCADDLDCENTYFCSSGQCIPDIVALSKGGYFHYCVGRADDSVSCWGSNTFGQLGDGTTTDRFFPGEVFGLSGKIKQVENTAYASCVLTEDGVVRCWGINHAGDIGLGPSVVYSGVPVALRFPTGRKALQLASGLRHSCALLDDASVHCWGSNEFGQSGWFSDASQTVVWQPTPVAGLGAVDSIGLGWDHSCAKLRAGTLACWGRNNTGQLGDGSQSDSAFPVMVKQRDTVGKIAVFDASSVVSISGGYRQTCVLTSAGLAYCWGLNISGEACLGTRTGLEPFVSLPVRSNDRDLKFDQYQVGGGHSCGRLRDSQELICCGWNDFGQASTLTTEGNVITPTKAIADKVAGFSTLGQTSCATLPNGSLYFFGNNQDGILGTGPTSGLVLPTRTPTAPRWLP